MLVLMAAAAFVVVLFASAVLKTSNAREFADFVASLAVYGIQSRSLRTGVAWLTISAEVAAGALLWVPGVSSRGRLVPGVVLIGVFTVAALVTATRSGAEACRCFGSASPRPLWLHLFGNGVLLFFGVIGIISHPGHVNAGDRLFAIGMGAIVGGGVVLSGVVYATLKAGLAATVHPDFTREGDLL